MIHDYDRGGSGSTRYHMARAYEGERRYRAARRAHDPGRTQRAEFEIDQALSGALRATKQTDAAKRIYGDE